MEPKNKNKGIILTLVLSILLTVGVTGYVYISSLCNLDGLSVCVDKDTGMFLIEKDASITVQVESAEQGQALVDTWNQLHPENINAVTVSVKPTLSIEDLKKGLETDVVNVSQEDGAFFMQHFMDLGRRASSTLGETIPALHQDSINAKGYYFVASSIKGPLFVYNETLMKSLGYDIEDADNSGLPDVFESWEQIMESSNDLSKNPSVVFPLTFEDQNNFYPFLTSGRWTLNFTKNGSNPEFSSNEFKEGLSLIEEMGKHVWDSSTAVEIVPETSEEGQNEQAVPNTEPGVRENQTDQNDNNGDEISEVIEVKNFASGLKWQYESAFFENKTLFTIANDFKIFDQYAESSDSTYVYAPFPLYKEHRLNPFATVEGYAVSVKTQYPSAATEAIRILRSPEFVSKYHEYTGKIPVYHRNHAEELIDVPHEVMDKIVAYSYSDTLPIMALNNNPSVLSRSIYSEIDIMSILSRLFDGVISVEETQEEIVLLSKEWIEKNDIIEEE